jgi:hypothetical protein
LTPRRWRRRTVVAGAVATAVVVAGVVILLGVLPTPLSLQPRPASTQGSVVFSAAQNTSNGRASAMGGGPWNLVEAQGFVDYGGYSWNESSFDEFGCTFHQPFPNVPPTDQGGLVAGQIGLWSFFYAGQDGGIAVVVVADGAIAANFSVSGGAPCLGTLNMTGHAATGLIDSPELVQSLNPAFHSFLTAHQDISGEVTLFFGSSIPGSVSDSDAAWRWSIILSACPGSAPPTFPFPNGPLFEGVTNASKPGVVINSVEGPAGCQSVTPS